MSFPIAHTRDAICTQLSKGKSIVPLEEVSATVTLNIISAVHVTALFILKTTTTNKTICYQAEGALQIRVGMKAA